MSKIIDKSSVVVETTFYGKQTGLSYSDVSREKVIIIDGVEVYKELVKHPYFVKKNNISMVLNDLDNELLLFNQSKSTKECRSNARNFIQRVKLFWVKLIS